MGSITPEQKHEIISNLEQLIETEQYVDSLSCLRVSDCLSCITLVNNRDDYVRLFRRYTLELVGACLKKNVPKKNLKGCRKEDYDAHLEGRTQYCFFKFPFYPDNLSLETKNEVRRLAITRFIKFVRSY